MCVGDRIFKHHQIAYKIIPKKIVSYNNVSKNKEFIPKLFVFLFRQTEGNNESERLIIGNVKLPRFIQEMPHFSFPPHFPRLSPSFLPISLFFLSSLEILLFIIIITVIIITLHEQDIYIYMRIHRSRYKGKNFNQNI